MSAETTVGVADPNTAIPPVVLDRVRELIVADTPSLYRTLWVSHNGNPEVDLVTGGAFAVGAAGAVAEVVGAVDLIGTRTAKGSYDVNEIRNDARKGLDDIEDDIEELMSTKDVDAGSICVDPYVCLERVIFDIDEQEGLDGYVHFKTEMPQTGLNDGEKETILGSLSEGTGPRTAESDAAQIESLNASVDAYVASFPDDELASTNASTGEALITGAVLLAGSVAAKFAHRRRQRNLIGRYHEAHDAVLNINANDYNIPMAARAEVASLRMSVGGGSGFSDYTSEHITAPPQPQGGGRPRRADLETQHLSALQAVPPAPS